MCVFVWVGRKRKGGTRVGRLLSVPSARGCTAAMQVLAYWSSPPRHTYLLVVHVCVSLASFPGLSGEGGKAWGLLRAHARKLPQNVVIAYYSNLSVTFVSILSVKAWERG